MTVFSDYALAICRHVPSSLLGATSAFLCAGQALTLASAFARPNSAAELLVEAMVAMAGAGGVATAAMLWTRETQDTWDSETEIAERKARHDRFCAWLLSPLRRAATGSPK
jgi:phosphate/sulfate permease